ncbi:MULTISPECIES: DUF378 domain-containing protein [Salinicoccus]|uniref:Uncharacterized membrane protein YuzA n=2 Tax=Salinicoccus TaxID=45669 RepID=A0A285UBK9_9STAP|nr:uncharacterized membrane protein YuzA [Salinicoccus kekensis]
MKALDMAALALVIIGGLNWLLVGLFEFDLVASIFGSQENIGAKIVYILVGLAALYSLKFFGHINDHHERAEDTNRVTGTGTTRTDADRTTGTTGADARTAGISNESKEVGPTAGSTKNKPMDADTRTGTDTRTTGMSEEVDPTTGSTKNKPVDVDTRTGADTRDLDDTDRR